MWALCTLDIIQLFRYTLRISGSRQVNIDRFNTSNSLLCLSIWLPGNTEQIYLSPLIQYTLLDMTKLIYIESSPPYVMIHWMTEFFVTTKECMPSPWQQQLTVLLSQLTGGFSMTSISVARYWRLGGLKIWLRTQSACKKFQTTPTLCQTAPIFERSTLLRLDFLHKRTNSKSSRADLAATKVTCWCLVELRKSVLQQY